MAAKLYRQTIAGKKTVLALQNASYLREGMILRLTFAGITFATGTCCNTTIPANSARLDTAPATLNGGSFDVTLGTGGCAATLDVLGDGSYSYYAGTVCGGAATVGTDIRMQFRFPTFSTSPLDKIRLEVQGYRSTGATGIAPTYFVAYIAVCDFTSGVAIANDLTSAGCLVTGTSGEQVVLGSGYGGTVTIELGC